MSRSMRADTAVVFVHGLWMTGLESFELRRQVQMLHDWSWHTFSYASVGQGIGDIVAALDRQVAAIDADTVHLIGHSLGGLVIYRALLGKPVWPPGRVVFLGTPSLRSHAAAQLLRVPFGTTLLGHAAEELLDEVPRHWQSERELGVIAGTAAYSFGRIVTRFGDEPNDGTVSVSETRLPGAKAHVMMPVSHTGMLFSAEVAAQAGQFLERGTFSPT